MPFTAIESKLLKVNPRRGGGVSSYFGGDMAASESFGADVMSALGVTGRAGSLAATESGADAFSSTGSAAQPSAGYLHSETFESLATGAAPSGGAGTFVWGGGKGHVNATAQADFPYAGLKSGRIRYPAAADQSDSAGQMAFNLGGGFSEVTIAFKWRIPSNYVHRAQASPNSQTNNKFFRLWPGGASDGDASYDYGEKVGASMWRGSSDSNSDLICDWDSGTGIGPKGGTYSNFITSADFGQWLDMEIYCKTATGVGSANGVLRIKKNGIIIRDLTNVDNWKTGRPHYFRYGYLMGWANSGYLNTTDFYLDNVNFTVVT